MNNEQQLQAYADLIEQRLPDYLPQGGLPYQSVADAMSYSLLGGGKRIRGALVLAFYRLYREEFSPAIPFAAAVEMIHAYSLIHDDLPCMDDDDMRRGKPSCHVAFGEATALLAGDALLNRAFEILTHREYTKGIPAKTVLQAISILSTASGVHGMIGGQVLDLDNEDKQITTEDLDAINTRKTGALICASAGMGCCLAGAPEQDLQAAYAYASCVGMAFQITDDVLDQVGDAKLLGKPVGSDQQQGKSTYATLLGVDRCREIVADLNRQAVEHVKSTGRDTAFLCWLADKLGSRNF